MKNLVSTSILLFSFTSCNVIQTMTGDETKINDQFFKNQSKRINTDLFNGLYGFWRLDESASTNKVDSQNNIVLVDNTTGSLTSIAGIKGNAIDCSVASSGSQFLRASTAFNKSLADSYAFSFWANLPANVAGGCSVYNNIVNFSGGYIMFEDTDCAGDNTDIQVDLGGGPINIVDVVDFTGGGWHHFAINIIQGGQSVDVFVDGTFVNSQTSTSTAVVTSYIGLCSDPTGNNTLSGKLDSLGIWNRVLTQSEITDLYEGNNNLD